MKPERARNLVAALVAAYPRASVAPETVSVYVRSLADLGEEEVDRAVRAVIVESAFFPSISEIRSRVVEERLQLPSPIEAWGALVDALDRGRPGAFAALDPEIRRALDSVGGVWEYRSTTVPGILRRDFLAAYEAIRRAAVERENLTLLGLRRDSELPAPPPVEALDEPEPTTEERDRNVRNWRLLAAALAGEITMEDAGREIGGSP